MATLAGTNCTQEYIICAGLVQNMHLKVTKLQQHKNMPNSAYLSRVTP